MFASSIPTAPLAAVLALALFPLTPIAAVRTAPEDPGDVPVLRVNDEPVSRDEYTSWLMRLRGENLAREYGEAWLIQRAARERGVEVPLADVKAMIEEEIAVRVQGAFAGDQEAWLEELAISGRTRHGYVIERTIAMTRELNLRALAAQGRIVPEAKIVREWERMHGPGGRQVRVRVLALPVHAPKLEPGLTDEEREARKRAALEEALGRARELRSAALAGADFGELVALHSVDSVTRDAGGEPVGGFDPTRWPRATAEAVAAMVPGGIAEPFETRGKVWLIEKVGIRETPLAAVRDEIAAELAALGPEPDEIEAAYRSVVEGVAIEALPAMWADAEPGGGLAAEEEPVLLVDGVPIRRKEYGRWLRHHQGEMLADRFARQRQLIALAKERGFEASEADIDARLDEEIRSTIEAGYEGKQEKWLAEIASSGRTVESFRRESHDRILADVLAVKMIIAQRKVTDEEARILWARRYGEDGRTIDVRMIAVQIPRPDLAGVETRAELEKLVEESAKKTEERMLSLRERALAGQDFGALAREYSDDRPSAIQGGEIVGGFQRSKWPADVVSTLLALDTGDISEPIRLDTAYYLFEITDAREVPFESVKEELRKELAQRPPSPVDIATFQNAMSRDVKVEVLPALLE